MLNTKVNMEEETSTLEQCINEADTKLLGKTIKALKDGGDGYEPMGGIMYD